MSEQPQAPQAVEQPADTGKPIPFKTDEMEKFKGTVAPSTSAPTSYQDCVDIGGHGGPQGKRIYYPHAAVDVATGQVVKGSGVCEICGMTELD